MYVNILVMTHTIRTLYMYIQNVRCVYHGLVSSDVRAILKGSRSMLSPMYWVTLNSGQPARACWYHDNLRERMEGGRKGGREGEGGRWNYCYSFMINTRQSETTLY